MDRRQQAARLIGQTIDYCRETGDCWMEPELLRIKSGFLFDRGDQISIIPTSEVFLNAAREAGVLQNPEFKACIAGSDLAAIAVNILQHNDFSVDRPDATGEVDFRDDRGGQTLRIAWVSGKAPAASHQVAMAPSSLQFSSLIHKLI